KAVATIDRAEVLADAGLLEDALAHVEQSIAALSEAEERIVLAEARLLAARVHGALGQFAEAARQAAEARLELERLQRFGWAVKARWVELSAARDAGRGLDAHAVATLATELAEAGWQFESLDALLVAVDLALGSGHAALARQLVGRLRRSPRDVPALLQIGRHRAVARTRLASGDRRGARRAITDALKLLHEHRLSHGSAELRAHASRHGQGLFAVAIELALEDDRPDDALVALDLLRDTDRPVWSRPPDDPELAAELERLRRLDAELREASREGADDRGLGRERARAERRIRDGLRRRAGATGTGERLDVAELVRALEGRHLCSWFVHEGQLGSIKVSAEGRRLRMLGPVDELVREIDAWRFALRRLAEGRGSGRRLEDAARSARAAADQLVSLLDLAEHPIGQDLVVVPTGVLRGLAWHCLHVLEGATVSVVPSAAYWLSQSTSAPAGGAVLAAAGPSLAAAQREVDQVASQHEDGRVLAGELATANAVIESLDGVAIGHLAAHGAFRWDNPLFSSLEFSDGPMWLHDFERLSSPPGTLVLSSCDMAMDRVVAGDAVVGMASGLLRLGVRTLIAPVVPVPDEETADFMVALHERMAAGASGGEALAAIAATWSGETPRQQAVKQSFVSFGA
ncbi:MAG: CHAT domain-containing protein, partial [Nitriliruptorales bacterium]|nr:CHAT domain-containing protein [Nitriliruptorales bacterium]